MNRQSEEIKKERYRLLRQLENWLEFPTVILGVVWLILLVIELTSELTPFLEYIVYFIWGVFIIEFLLRLFLAPDKILFFKRNIITLLALIVPALRVFRIFQALRILRVARAVRGIRLFRVLSSLNRGFKSMRKVFGRRGFGYVVSFSILVTFVGAAAMYGLESGNEGFKSYGDSLWWVAMMMTTSGSAYWPETLEGRILAFLIALYAFAVFGYLTATIASFFIEREADSESSEIAGQKDLKKIYAELRNLQEELKKNRTGS